MASTARPGMWSPWSLWKRATGFISATPRVQVDQAMDRATRKSAPWRYRIWAMAWVLLVVPYMAVFGSVAVYTSYHPITPAWLENVVLYGPAVMILILAMACRAIGSRGPQVPLMLPDSPREQEKEARSLARWQIGVGILVAVSVIGRLYLMMR